MKLFTEDSSLKTMNDVLVAKIPNYSLIGDIPLSEKDFMLLASRIETLFRSNGNQKIINMLMESIAVFLVFSAVYEYDNRTFWKPIEKYIGDLNNNRRNEFYSIFSKVLDKYQLNQFENESEEGYTHVTPILCHAGIPINAFDNYFAAISNTVDDAFYDDFDVDDYLSYLKNKTEVTVKRYIKLTNKKDSYNFIQNTRKLIVSDSVDKDDEIETGNYIRMFEQVSTWKEKPKVKKNLQARSKVQITAPKIKIDFDGVGIYCEIPRIIVKDSYDSYIIWEITSDETTSLVRSEFFRRSGVLVSEEKILPLRPALSYTISLKVDDNQISKWEFDGVRENYIAFTQNGNVIKSETLPNSSVILLLNKNISFIGKEELPITEMPSIPLWPTYNVYHIDLTDLKELQITDLTIRVNAENKPIIDGGVTLFHQENSGAFIKLPYIKVPVINEGEWHLEIKYKAEGNVISKSIDVVPSDSEIILLSSYIQKERYGNYDIKLWNRTGISGKFSIEYVPFGSIKVDKNEYWPSSYKGYLNKIQFIRTCPGVEIDIYNAEKIAEIHNENNIVYKYKVSEHDRFLIGEYRYISNGNTFSTPIKKSIYPVSWGIFGFNNEIIELSSKVYTLTLQDFFNATDPYLLFAFEFDSMYDIRNLKLDLVGPDRSVVLSTNISIKNKEGLRIPLNSYLFEVQNALSEIDYHLRVSLLDENENLISRFLVARIQDEVVIKSAQYTQNENDIFISWDEEGTKSGRECVLVNFLKPWSNPYHIPIEDKMCKLTISKEKLEEGIYRYLIQKETEELFFEDAEAEICSLRDFQKGRFLVKGENHFSTNMERILYQLLRSRFIKKELVPKRLSHIESAIGNLRVKVPEDIHYLAHAFILYDRFFADNEDARKILDIFAELFDLLSSYGNETIRYVLDSAFSSQYKKELLHKFYCNNLTSNLFLNDIQHNLLAEIDENMAGFISLINSENNIKGLNWAGISDIGVLREEDLFGEGDVKATFLSDENLGKSSYITDYFQFVWNELLRPKNMNKRTEDFIKEFQKENEVQETIVFGKTRLHLLAEWKDHNKSADLIQSKLSQVIDIPCEIKLKEQFKDAFQALSKRKPDDELGYCIGLIALYASFIRNGLMSERKEFSRLLNYTIETCEKLYYRDALIMELYMHLERGYSWV